MAKLDDRFARLTWRVMEQLLEVDAISESLTGCLELIVREMDAQAGVIWIRDLKSDTLLPMFMVGTQDLSGVTVDNGIGVEGGVVKSGKSALIADTANDASYEGSIFEDQGIAVKSVLCVPLNDLNEIIGCLCLVNKNDGSGFTDDELQFCERTAALAAITIAEKGLELPTYQNNKVLISLRNIIKEFPSGDTVSRVLKGINLDIYENEFVVVLGESGCGKSTMMNIIGGMDFATDGQLFIEGKDFSHPNDNDLTRYRREYVGFIFQSYNLMPNLTALENIQFIAELAKDPMDSKDALNKVGLLSRANNYPSMLSGGQQQRVSIARAIVKNPRIIFADEPTAALDYTTSIEVLEVIEQIVKERGTTVMMITHNPEIAKMADRVVKIRSGLIHSIRINHHPLKAKELSW